MTVSSLGHMDALEIEMHELREQQRAQLRAERIARENEYLRSLEWEGDELQRFNERRDGVIARLATYRAEHRNAREWRY
jgi:hypothetical protein